MSFKCFGLYGVFSSKKLWICFWQHRFYKAVYVRSKLCLIKEKFVNSECGF